MDKPEIISDFRVISLCNVSYKVITKIISRCLRDIMGKIVRRYRCSFIAGRHSSDNIIIAQQVIHSIKAKIGRKGCMAVKVDLEKAYDHLELSFPEKVYPVVLAKKNTFGPALAATSHKPAIT